MPDHNNVIVGLFWIGNEFREGIGHDDDNDGVLDNGEVEHWVSKCGYVDGFNQDLGWFRGGDGEWYWIHRNFSENSNQWMTYIYDPRTGNLKVYHGPDGQLVYNGPAEDFWGW